MSLNTCDFGMAFILFILAEMAIAAGPHGASAIGVVVEPIKAWPSSMALLGRGLVAICAHHVAQETGKKREHYPAWGSSRHVRHASTWGGNICPILAI